MDKKHWLKLGDLISAERRSKPTAAFTLRKIRRLLSLDNIGVSDIERFNAAEDEPFKITFGPLDHMHENDDMHEMRELRFSRIE